MSLHRSPETETGSGSAAAHQHRCDACGVVVEGADLQAFSDAYVEHAHRDHPDWPYPDQAIRNVAEATQRLTGPTVRLDEIGKTEIRPVSPSRIDDWRDFFDHDAYAGNPVDAACYCSGPHTLGPGRPGAAELTPWRHNRDLMCGLLCSGQAFGYLAYVDGRPAGWANASMRATCSMYRRGVGVDPPDKKVVSLSCFVIAPPYRRHGLARALLRRAVADAPARGARWVEAYPLEHDADTDRENHRGHRALFSAHGFEVVEIRDRLCVMRRRVGGWAGF
jgi:ribosomal protein S18 acetylase RimI-like enzyme